MAAVLTHLNVSFTFIKMPRDSTTFMDASYKTCHISLLFVFRGLTHSFLMTKGENPGEQELLPFLQTGK